MMKPDKAAFVSTPNPLKKAMYLGLFGVALSTLMYEILLSRIFSVTMWFHFAFVAISIAMFGMTVGAIIVYLKPDLFTEEKATRHLAFSSLGMAVTMVLSFIAHLNIPFVTKFEATHLFNIGLTYVAISLPFIFSGIAVSLALTKFPRYVGRLYAADLAGASLGCVLIVLVLGAIDGPSAVFLSAAFGSLAAALFADARRDRNIRMAAFLVTAFLFGMTAYNAFRDPQSPLFRLVWIKGAKEAPPIYEKWNSFSRITVSGDPNGEEAFGWGLSSQYSSADAPPELMLKIDSGAATPITSFDGNIAKLDHLKYDATNIVHTIRQNADVLVVGTGGGRDILSALAFEQHSVTGVEINGTIIDTVNRRFGDFSGHLDRHPRVRFINDEARSWIARSPDKFDIIQVSFIDTSAATAAGAYVFTENSLYTVEAWKIFLDHLKPGGVLTFCRWYYLDLSGEAYRMVTLARAALREKGIQDPGRHILLVRHHPKTSDHADVGTILVSPEPFTDSDIANLDAVCRRLDFDIVLAPGRYDDEVLKTLVSAGDLGPFYRKFPINIAPPTDNDPFFFSVVRPWQALNKEIQQYKLVTFNMKSIIVLAGLLMIVTALTLACIFLPLALSSRKADLRNAGALFAYFAAIGLGFMLVEISQMQRLVLFLGHPVYGLSVVLFTLLLSSSLGSYSVKDVSSLDLHRKGMKRLGLLIAAAVVFGFLTPPITVFFQAATTPIRILVALAILSPLGFFMGTAFPLGMKAAEKKPALTPWLWGINGATSVFASVLAVVIALSAGIAASFWVGVGCYAVALAAFGQSFRLRISRADDTPAASIVLPESIAKPVQKT